MKWLRKAYCACYGHCWLPMPADIFAPLLCHRCGYVIHAGGWSPMPNTDQENTEPHVVREDGSCARKGHFHG